MNAPVCALFGDPLLAVTVALTVGVVIYFGGQFVYRTHAFRVDRRKREKIRRQFWGYE